MTANPTNDTHPMMTNDETGKCIIMPLSLRGITFYLPAYKVITKEWE